MSTSMTERYLTIKDAAKILGVTPLTLRNWDKKGVLTAHRNPINNYRMYRHADVFDLVAAIEKKQPDRGVIQKLKVIEEI